MDRYARQTILSQIGIGGQEKLLASSILIIGVGGLGCPAAQLLAGAGVGKIGLMDGDKVHISNLHRQTLFSEQDIGLSKAIRAKDHLKNFNSEIQIHAYDEFLSHERGMTLFKQFDLILDCTDNIPSRLLINDICCTLDKPWVYGGVRQFEGQLAVFNYQEGPSYRCLFPNNDESAASCMVEGVLGSVPAIIGSYMTNEALKILLRIGNPISGKIQIFNFLTNENTIYKVTKDPKNFST